VRGDALVHRIVLGDADDLASGPFSSSIQNTPIGRARTHTPWERRLLEQHEGIERVVVLGERVGDEAVVGRVHGRGEQAPVEADHVALVVVLVLVAAATWDLDDDVERRVVGCGVGCRVRVGHRRTVSPRR